MHFCPNCGNLLLIEEGDIGMQFCCPLCPFTHRIERNYKSKTKIKKKAIDDVLGGSDAWDNVDRTRLATYECPIQTM